jgi:hypothetical protein
MVIGDDYKYALMIYSAKSSVHNSHNNESSTIRKLKFLGYSYLFIPKIIKSVKGLFADFIELMK